MDIKKGKLDRVAVARGTAKSKRYIEKTLEAAQKISTDSEKVQRLKEGLCPSCYYLYHDRMGGAVITHRPCACCESEMSFGNTATDLLCLPCGKENGICVRCAADMELKDRRKPYPFQKKLT